MLFSKKSSSSATTNQYTTNNTDKRIVNDGGLVAQDGSNINYTSNTNIESVDKDIANAAFTFATRADATNGEGFQSLLRVTEKIASNAADSSTTLAARFQDSVLDAFERAKTTETGSLDQKTIIILAIAAAAALVLVNRKGKA